MKFNVYTREKRFSPKEAGAITGVSPALQRNWRRREILPPREGDGWGDYSLAEVIRMAVMKAFSDGGISVLSTQDLAAMAVAPVIKLLTAADDVAVFKGLELSPEQQQRIRMGHVGPYGPAKRYLFTAMPDSGNAVNANTMTDLKDAETVLQDANKFYGLVIDHLMLAERIANTAKLPLIEWEVTVAEQA